MYDLVNDIESYPEFLPWCPKAEVLQRDDREVTARLGLAHSGLHTSFTTRNTMIPNERIDMHLQDGPFQHLHGVWTFTALTNDSCHVVLDMDFEVKGSLRFLLLPVVFAEVCNRLVQAFSVEARRRARRE